MNEIILNATSSNYGPWQYEVELYDLDTYRSDIHHGITFADNFSTAAACVEKYYGNEIITLKLSPLEPQTVYDFDDDWDTEGELFSTYVGYKRIEKEKV